MVHMEAMSDTKIYNLTSHSLESQISDCNLDDVDYPNRVSILTTGNSFSTLLNRIFQIRNAIGQYVPDLGVVVCGGFLSDGSVTDVCNVLDPDVMKWEPLPKGNMMTKRCAMLLNKDGNRIIYYF